MSDLSEKFDRLMNTVEDISSRMQGVEAQYQQQKEDHKEVVTSLVNVTDRLSAIEARQGRASFSGVVTDSSAHRGEQDYTSSGSSDKKSYTTKPGPTFAWLGKEGPHNFLQNYNTPSFLGGGNPIAEAEANSAAEVQRAFEQVKEGLVKVKLPHELKVYNNPKGIKADCQAAYSILSNCATYTETASKWVAEKSADIDDGYVKVSTEDLQELFTILYAQTSFLKGEYTGLIVKGITDEETAKTFKLFERNPTAFSETAVKHLASAAEIASIKARVRDSQASGQPRRSRGSFQSGQGQGRRGNNQGGYRQTYYGKGFPPKNPGFQGGSPQNITRTDGATQ